MNPDTAALPPGRREGHIYARLCEPETLKNAWYRVLGHYRQSERPPAIEEFERKRVARLDRLAGLLRRQEYNPEPAALVFIPKPHHPGERRNISLLDPEDRVVLSALEFLLEPILGRDFEPMSFAYRRGLGAGAALRQVREFLARGWRWAAGADVDNFFDSIDRRRLQAMLRERIWEPAVLRLLEIYLGMGSHRGLEWVDSGRGIAQGSPLSPLLANFYLDPLDHALSRWAGQTGAPALAGWIRYGDNLLVMAGARELAEAGMAVATRVAEGELGLEWNRDSRFVREQKEGFEFLGFYVQEERLRISPAKLAEIKAGMEERLRSFPGGPGRALESLSEAVTGWKRYYHRGDTADQLAELDARMGQLLVSWLGFELGKAGAPARARWAEWLTGLERTVSDTPAERRKWVADLLRGEVSDTSVAREPAAGPKTELSPGTQAEAAAPMPLSARQVIARRKRELEVEKTHRSDFLVTEPGTFLGVHGEHLYERRDGRRCAEVPLAELRHISVLEYAGAISGALIVETAKRGIAIDVLGHDGRPLARVSPPDAPSFEVSAAQIRLAGTPAGLKLGRAMVVGKMKNQRSLLRYFAKYRARANSEFAATAREAGQAIDGVAREVAGRVYDGSADLTLERDRLFAAEGHAAECYWKALGVLLRPAVRFDGRVRRGANDLVNELLNYGYGILYGRLLGVLTRAGLNPNIGFVHAPQTGRPALLYDFIEEFRSPAVDQVVCSRLNKGARFALDADGLDVETRRRLARAVTDRLHMNVRYRGRAAPLLAVMDRQASLLADHVLGRSRYKPFAAAW